MTSQVAWGGHVQTDRDDRSVIQVHGKGYGRNHEFVRDHVSVECAIPTPRRTGRRTETRVAKSKCHPTAGSRMGGSEQ